MKERIMITGGAGFIGSAVNRAAGNKCECIVADNFSDNYDIMLKLRNVGLDCIPPENSKTGRIYNMDILNMDNVNRIITEFNPDVIIHAAALPGIRQSMQEPYRYFNENIQSTMNIVESARINNVKHIIFLSSSSVYGDNEVPFTEEMNPRPQSVYAQSKHSCEDLLHMYSMTYSVNIIVLRLFTVFGPAQRPDLAIHKFFLNAHRGRESEIYGSMETYRDYTYIDDAVQGIMQAFEHRKHLQPFEIFNIGSKHKIYMKDLLNRVKHYFPDFLYKLTAHRDGDLYETLSDVSKAENLLGYRNKTDFNDGMDLFYEWFKEYYNA